MSETLKHRILFVDSDSKTLAGLRGSLESMQDHWDLDFAADRDEALEKLAVGPCDIVVADLGVPNDVGAAMLREVLEDYPDTLRIILTDSSELESLEDILGTAHQVLTKPFEVDRLMASIERAFELRDTDREAAIARLLPTIRRLPSLPDLYLAIMDELSSADPSIANVGKIVARDVAMSAKILQIVNSVVFGTRLEVTDPSQAAVYLGVDSIKSLVLSIKVFEQFDESQSSGVDIRAMWEHSFRVAALAKAYARRWCRAETEESFLGGMLHDLGAAIFAVNNESYGQVIAQAAEEGRPKWVVEREAYGVTHAELGAYLVGTWGLPEAVVHGIQHHHEPERASRTSFDSVAAVHLADIADHGVPTDEEEHRQLCEYLESIGSSFDEWDAFRRNWNESIEAAGR